jgi:hypothetical protein
VKFDSACRGRLRLTQTTGQWAARNKRQKGEDTLREKRPHVVNCGGNGKYPADWSGILWHLGMVKSYDLQVTFVQSRCCVCVCSTFASFSFELKTYKDSIVQSSQSWNWSPKDFFSATVIELDTKPWL